MPLRILHDPVERQVPCVVEDLRVFGHLAAPKATKRPSCTMLVICWTSPPASVLRPDPIPPMRPTENTLLPITRLPGLYPFWSRQYISLPESPVITAMAWIIPPRYTVPTTFGPRRA